MASIDYTVRRVPIERTLALRKAVLRPYLADDEPYVLPDDHLPTTVTFGAVTPDDRVIGVAPAHAGGAAVRHRARAELAPARDGDQPRDSQPGHRVGRSAAR